MQNQIPPQVQETINYYTNRLTKMFRLQPADQDDVRQELTLTALEAMKNYSSEINANSLTYTKAALRNGAAGVIRQNGKASPIVEYEELQDDFMQLASPDAIDTSLDLELKLDMEAILRTLSHRQQAVCRMIMDGYNQPEIAKAFHVTKQRIHHIIRQIRTILEKNSAGPLTEFPFLQLSTYREPPKEEQ